MRGLPHRVRPEEVLGALREGKFMQNDIPLLLLSMGAQCQDES